MNMYDTMLAVLANSTPPAGRELGKLDQRASDAQLHMSPTCRLGLSVSMTSEALPFETLMGLAEGKRFTVCVACTSPHLAGGCRWLCTIWTMMHTSKKASALEAAQEAALNDNIATYAESMQSAAAAFNEDDSTSYKRHASDTPWYNDALRDLHEAHWVAGKKKYETLIAAATVSTRLLAEQEAPATFGLVVAGKGRRFTSRGAAGPQSALTYTALLEAPRVAQTEDWFVTRETPLADRRGWSELEALQESGPRIINLPDEYGPEAIVTGLHLWDGHSGADLEQLIEGAHHALTT